MKSPIERKPNNDKTLMPLRGEGNQPPKPPHIINLELQGNGLMSTDKIKELINHINGSLNGGIILE